MAEAAVVSALLWVSVFQVLVRWRWSFWAGAGLVGAISFVDWGFIHYGGMRFRLSQATLDLGGSSSYINGANVLVCLVLIGLHLVGAWRLLRVNKTMKWNLWQAQVTAIILLLVLTPAYWVHVAVNAPWPAVWRNGAKSHYAEASRFASPPVLLLANNSFSAKQGSTADQVLPGDVEALADYRRTTTNEQPPKLKGPVPRRIILVTMESYSARFQSARNPDLPGVLTPFLDAQRNFLTNFRSVSLPTQFALASHFCSHPNGIALATSGHPHALPAYLSANGWHTVNFQPAALSFQSAARRFRELGFQQIFDRDQFAQNPELKDYISGWGLCDRKVYEQAAAYLGKNKMKPVFMHILTADTHGPEGRLNYHNLRYPPTPSWVLAQGDYAKTLESWFRADYDLSLFIEELKKQGVWDAGTVVIVTGDHNATLGYGATPWSHTQPDAIEKMPWVLIMPGRNVKLVQTEVLASQCDTAPTIAHLAGLPLLPEWWGQSLLAPRVGRPLLAWREKLMEVELDGSISDVDSTIERLFWRLETGPSKPSASSDASQTSDSAKREVQD